MINSIAFTALSLVAAATVSNSNAAVLAKYDFEASGSGNDFVGQAGLSSVDLEVNSSASVMTTGGPQGLDGGGSNNIFNFTNPGSASGAPVSNWGNGNNSESTANFAQFTIAPLAGYEITFESLSLYHGAYNLTPKFKITYMIGSGVDVEALGVTSHTAEDGDLLTFKQEDFTDFTTDQAVTWKIHLFDADLDARGTRLDDIIINGVVTAVPEPSTTLLSVFSMTCLLMVRRRSS